MEKIKKISQSIEGFKDTIKETTRKHAKRTQQWKMRGYENQSTQQYYLTCE